MISTTDASAYIGILVGALVAALGYVGKLIVDTVKAWRAENERRLSQLHRLHALLKTSRAVFLVQRDLAGSLAERLRSRLPARVGPSGGSKRCS